MHLVRLGRQAFDPDKLAGIRINEPSGPGAPGAVVYLEAGGTLSFWGVDAEALARFVESLPPFGEDGGDYAEALPRLTPEADRREQGG